MTTAIKVRNVTIPIDQSGDGVLGLLERQRSPSWLPILDRWIQRRPDRRNLPG
jgi:hypothetical protein